MKNQLFFIITSLILIFGCTGNSNSKKLSFTISSKEIPVSSDYLGTINYPVVVNQSNRSLLFSLNKLTNSIEIFDLEKLKPIKKITYEINGPNGTGLIYEYFPYSFDSLFLLSDYEMTVADSNSNVLYRLDIHTQSSFDDFYLHPKGTLGRFQIFFDPNKSGVFGRFIKKGIPRENKEYYEQYIEGMISLKDTSLTLLKVRFPSLYRQNHQFGVLSYASRTISKNVFIYTFHVDPNIYLFEEEKGIQTIELPRINALSRLLRNQSDHESILYNLLENDVYLEVIPDPYNNLYYQFVLGTIEKSQQGGGIIDPGKKPIFLRVFDSSFKMLDQIQLDYQKYLPAHSFVTSEGLWLNKETPYRENNEENIIEYDVINFDL